MLNIPLDNNYLRQNNKIHNTGNRGYTSYSLRRRFKQKYSYDNNIKL